jgi:hypothetical protein
MHCAMSGKEDFYSPMALRALARSGRGFDFLYGPGVNSIP